MMGRTNDLMRAAVFFAEADEPTPARFKGRTDL